MTIEQIRQLTRWVRDAGLSGLEIRQPGFELAFTLGRTPVPAAEGGAAVRSANTPPLPPKAAPVNTVNASGPGLFRLAHPAQPQPLVNPGDSVAVGQLVGLLQVANLFLPVRSDRAGRIGQVLASDGQTVGYGHPLMTVED